jgi:hypothetical protein
MIELTPGMDFRQPGLRREVFHRFYSFHLRHRSHPGGVYYLLPHLAERLGWDAEQALWFAFLNGNTQHPITSLLLHQAGPGPAHADQLLGFWRRNYGRLGFDTDRRYHKKHLDKAVAGYLTNLAGAPQLDYWTAAAGDGFAGVWTAARAIPTFGRLSAFSFAEYLKITLDGLRLPRPAGFDCDTLMLDDHTGSKSHRNGLCKVLGLDALDWHPSNPNFDGHYNPAELQHLTGAAAVLLAEARQRAWGQPWAADVGNFTLESALCTYKSWHRPNRRYPNVYNDMLHDRIRQSEERWPTADLSLFWEARAVALPRALRLEDQPFDPGMVPAKQNHYLLTGQQVMLDHDDPAFTNDFQAKVDAHGFGRCR